MDVNTDAFQRRALARSRVLDQINFECRPILADGPLLSQAQFSIQRNTMLKGLEKTYEVASVLI